MQLPWAAPRAPAEGFKVGQNPGLLSCLGSLSLNVQRPAWCWPSKAMMFGPSRVLQPLVGPRGVYGLHGVTMVLPWCHPIEAPDAAPVSCLTQACPQPPSLAPHSRAVGDTRHSCKPSLSSEPWLGHGVHLCPRYVQQCPRCIRLCQSRV